MSVSEMPKHKYFTSMSQEVSSRSGVHTVSLDLVVFMPENWNGLASDGIRLDGIVPSLQKLRLGHDVASGKTKGQKVLLKGTRLRLFWTWGGDLKI